MDKEEIIRIAGEAGAKAALEAWEKQFEERKREQKNTRLWNTRMLLKHYKSLKEYCKKAVYDRSTAAVSANPIEILESLGTCDKDMYIDAVKSSVVRTKTIMAHVDNMLKVYEIYCERSDKPEDTRRYRVLCAVYLAEDKMKMEEICKIENIDRSTYYRDNRDSTEMLSALIFGLDGLSAMRKT